MTELKPNAPVRRFDVFAEYNRLKALKEGESESQAKGYGLWVAKVVAAQKFGRLPKPGAKQEQGGEKEPKKKTKWHELSGIPQTNKLYDQEIISRMGRNFYHKVFEPSIKEAFDEGKDYKEIRDAIRREWKPAK